MPTEDEEKEKKKEEEEEEKEEETTQHAVVESAYLRSRGRFLSRGEDHSVHRRHLIANLSHLALPHKLNDHLNGWPSRYAKERFFGYFAKYPVKDFDGPLRSSMPSRRRARRAGPGSLGERDALLPLQHARYRRNNCER